MPYLLFGSGLDTTRSGSDRSATATARASAGTTSSSRPSIDARAQLLALFEAAKRHDCFVIVSSWEYQQSSSFAAEPAWCEALMAIDPEDRAEAQAVALADLIDFLAEHGLDDRIAFTEIHNEVQVGHLADGLPRRSGRRRIVALRPRLERALRRLPPPPPRPAGHRQLRPGPGRRDARHPRDDRRPGHPSVRVRRARRLHRDVRPARPAGGLRPDPGRARAAAARRAEARRVGAGPAVAADARPSWPSPRSTSTTGATPRPSTAGSTGTTRPGSRRWSSTLRLWLDVARDWAPAARRTARLRRGLGRLHPQGRPVRGGTDRRRVLPARHRGVHPGRRLGHDRLLQRRAAARHVGRRRPAAAVQRGLPHRHRPATSA